MSFENVQVRRQPGVNGLAIASFVCSLFWGYGLLSVVAIVLSLMARKQIREHQAQGLHQSGDGFALAGLIIGIVGAVITGMVVLLILAFNGYGVAVAALLCAAIVGVMGYVVLRHSK